MFGPFAEAIRATTQPCTFLLIAPMVIALVCARARWSAIGAVVVAAIVGGWLLVGNWFVLDGWWLNLSAVLMIAILAALVLPQVGDRWQVTTGAPFAATSAGVVTVIAALWWRPCVGAELGAILTAGQADVLGQLPPMTAYMLGVVLPVVAVGLLYRSIEPGAVCASGPAFAAFAAGLVVAGSVAIGQHDHVVVTLTRWTTG